MPGMDQPSQLTAEVPWPWARPRVLVPVFVLISVVGAAFPSFSLGANVLVLAAGGCLFWLGLAARLPRRRSPRRLTARAAWWLVPMGVLTVVELVDFALGSTYDHPTLSVLFDPLLEGYAFRAAAYFAWLMAYWGLVRR
jgi:hypothetical protein